MANEINKILSSVYWEQETKILGKRFENFFIEEMIKKFVSVERTTDTVLDWEQGTDYIWEGYRHDITTNFHGKDNMIDMGSPVFFRSIGATIRFGYRTANKVHEFEEPVLVIGLDMDMHILKRYYDVVTETIGSHIIEIIRAGDALYQERIWA